MLNETESLVILKKEVGFFPETVVMLGTGWGEVLHGLNVATEIPYKKLFGVPASVPGHEGKLVIAGQTAYMQGRLHLYEGYSGQEATLPIRVMAKAGMKRLVITSASGGLNPKYQVGDVVVLADLITLFLVFDNPLVGPKFTDISEVFDPELRQQALQAADKVGIKAHEGTYVYYHGPNFETPADKMALRQLGADVCGMSTVPEAIQSHSMGVKILGLSCVTNLAFVKHDHKAVLAAAKNVGDMLGKLILKVL